jgi:hypothetical protein
MIFYKYILYCFFGNTEEKKVTITSMSKDYFDVQKHNFLKTYELSQNFNENVDSCFYNKKELNLLLTDENNELEKKWKTKILFENSPRGNIIMYYDAFKQGFAYYSDQTSIPYNLLNAVAMKYVRIYRCRDFFVDNCETPEDKLSPLLDSQEKIEKKPEEKKPEEKKEVKESKKLPFANFKSYNTVSKKLKDEKKDEKNDEKKEEKKDEKEEKHYIRNKFICLGKICNFYILQSNPKKKGKRMATFKSNLIDSMKSSQLQTPAMSYSDFKKLKQQQN